MPKLSSQLMDAYMVNDQDAIARLRGEVDLMQQARSPQRDGNTYLANSILNDDQSSAITIYEYLNKTLGQEWDEWEIETIDKMLWIKHGVALDEINRDKVLAIRHVCSSDGCFSDWYEFNQVCLAFSGVIADFEYLRIPTTGMVINGFKTVNYIRPDRKSYFSDEVLDYICIILFNDGIYTPPPSMINVIGERIKKFVSKETTESWEQILKRYKEIVSKKNGFIKEESTDIQARRLVSAEASSLVYGAA